MAGRDLYLAETWFSAFGNLKANSGCGATLNLL
jgi:hypothetical protein